MTGLQLSDFWAWLRYFPAVDRASDLRLTAAWADIDPHQKTILSDDWGMGFTTSIVGDLLGVAIWANTLHVLELLGRSTATLRRSGRRGPSKSPDFLGLTHDWRFVVLECKGTQSKLDTLDGQLDTGLDQKKAVTFANSTALREKLAGGLFIPGDGGKEPATLKVRDPEPPEEYDFGDMNEDDIAAAVCQSELAAVLPLAGFVRTAAFLEGAAQAATDSGLPDDCAEEIAAALNREAGDFVGVDRVFPLPLGTMKTVEGSARAVRASIALDRTVMRTLRDSKHLSTTARELARRAVGRVTATPLLPRTVRDQSGDDDGAWASPVSTLVTASGIRVSVEWLSR